MVGFHSLRLISPAFSISRQMLRNVTNRKTRGHVGQMKGEPRLREARGNDSNVLPNWRQKRADPVKDTVQRGVAGRAYRLPQAITRDITDTTPTPISPMNRGEREMPLTVI